MAFECRTELASKLHHRKTFQATFLRFGKKAGYKGRTDLTLILINILDLDDTNAKTNTTDHLWFTCGKGFDQLDLHAGDIIRFNGTINSYEKGYREDDDENPIRIDYHLTYPRSIVKVGHDNSELEYGLDEIQSQKIKLDVAQLNKQRYDRIGKWIEEQNNPHPNKEREQEKKNEIKPKHNTLDALLK